MVAPVVSMPSNKHSGVSGIDTQLFVQHSAESPLRGGYAQSLTKWAQIPLNQGGPEASWPSFVDPIARVRMVAWPNSAWTQGLANHLSVGLECAGYARFSKAEWRTPEGLKQLDNLAHEWVYYWRLEKDAGNEIPRRWLTTAEVQKVMAGNRSIKGFCTHAQIDPASRSDPGPNFPYAELMDRIKVLIGDKATTQAASTTKHAPIEKDWFDMASEADLKKVVEAVVADLPSKVWGYKNDSVEGKRDAYAVLRDLPRRTWAYKNDNVTKSQAYSHLVYGTSRLERIIAQNAALEAAVAALAEVKGVDPAVVQATVSDAVHRALAGVSITLETATVDEGEAA